MLFYWWMNQKLYPSLSLVNGKMEDILSRNDFELLKTLPPNPLETLEKVREQGVHESLCRDIMTVFGKWEFDPLDISNPWPHNDGVAHIWQGLDDKTYHIK